MSHMSEQDWERLASILQGQLDQHHERLKEFFMAAIDDLNTAVASLQTVATEVETAFNASDQSPAIEAAVGTINTVVSSLTALVAPPAAPAAN